MKKILAGVFAFVFLISIIPGAIAQDESTAGSTASIKTTSVESPQPKVVQETTGSGQRVLIEMPFEEKGQTTMKEIIVNIPEEEEDRTIGTLPIEEPALALPEEGADTAQKTVAGRATKETGGVAKARSYTVVVDAPVLKPVRGATAATAAGEVVEGDSVSGGAGKGVVGLPASTKAISGGLVPIAAPKGIEVKIEAAVDHVTIESGEVKATTTRAISIKENKIYILTEADEKKEVAIMPSQVKEIMEVKPREFMGETVTEEAIASSAKPTVTVKKIELVVEEEKPVYNVEAEEDGKLFAFIPVKLKVESKVDAVSGIVEQTKRPWWSFLVFGQMKKAD